MGPKYTLWLESIFQIQNLLRLKWKRSVRKFHLISPSLTFKKGQWVNSVMESKVPILAEFSGSARSCRQFQILIYDRAKNKKVKVEWDQLEAHLLHLAGA